MKNSGFFLAIFNKRQGMTSADANRYKKHLCPPEVRDRKARKKWHLNRVPQDKVKLVE